MNEYEQPVRRGARHRGLQQYPRQTLTALAVAACFTGGSALANPTNPTVAHGAAHFANPAANVLNVTTATSKTIINWGSFSIAAGELTKFLQPSAASAVLNRVAAGNPSQILGALQSNGRVFLINPSGILFGAGAQIDVAGLIASTLNLSDTDFLSGRLRFTETPGAGSLINQGAITTPSGGNVYLVGPAVTNNGIITSPKGEVVLAAGNRVELVDPATPNLRVEVVAPNNEAVNLGTISAEAGRIGIYAGLINQKSTVNANSVVVGENGSIELRATRNSTLDASSITTANGPSGGNVTIQSGDTTMVIGAVEARGTEGKGGSVQVLGNLVGLTGNASVDASGQAGGGTVLVGGDFQGKNPEVQNAFRTYVGPVATIRADAVENGDGGKVIVWADDITRYYGSISARGGMQSGDGGFVEVSGKRLLKFDGRVDLTAPLGHAGTLLLDPINIEISGNADTNTVGFTAGTDNTEDFGEDATLNSVFNVNTSFTGVGNGATITLQAENDINVITDFNLATATGNTNVSLVLQAGKNINVGVATANSTITASGTGTITLSADDATSPVGGADGIGNINLGGTFTGSLVTANQPITLKSAGLSINGAGTVNAGTSEVRVFTSQPVSKQIAVGTAAVGGALTLDNTTMGKITAGTLVVGDIVEQVGDISIKGATPPTGKHFTAAQSATGGGKIVLDDSGGVPLTTGTGNISLSAGTGGVTANATNATNELSSTGTVTLNTSGPIGNSTNRIQLPATMAPTVGNVTAPTGGVFLHGLNGLTLGNMTIGGKLDVVTATGNIVDGAGTVAVTGTSRFEAGAGANDITFFTGGHDFQGVVTLIGSNVDFRQGSTSPLVLAPFSVSDFQGQAPNSEIRLSGIYTATGGGIDFNSPTTRLTGNTTVTGAQAVFFHNDVLGPGALSLNQNSGTGVVQLPNNLGTGAAPLAGLTINNASTNNLSFTGVNVAGNVDVTSGGNIVDGAGAIAVTGTSKFAAGAGANDITFFTGGHDFQGVVTLIGSNVDFRQGSTSPLVLAPFSVSDFQGQAPNSEIRLSGIYTATGGGIDFNSPTTRLTGNTTVTGAQAVFFHNDVLGPGALSLNQNSGTGVVQLPNNLGTGAAPLAGLTINNASTNNLSFTGVNVAGNVDVTSGGNIVDGAGAIAVTGTSKFAAGAGANDITFFTGGHDFQGVVTLIGSNVDFRQGSTSPLVLAPFSVSDFQGQAPNSEIRLSGIYTATGGGIDFNSPTTRLTGNTTVTGAQAVFFHNDVLGPGALILNQNSVGGIVQLPTNLGTVAVPLGGFTINNASSAFPLNFSGVNIAGNVSATSGDQITFNNPVVASGDILVQSTGGNIQINASGSFTAGGAGNALTLAGVNFVNNAGAGALSTPSGRWLVYSTSPVGSTENGLTAVAGSTDPRLYNRTFAANGPGTITQPGNHLIYSFQPTLNVTADAATRPYGAADPVFTYTASGFFADTEFTDTLTGAGLVGALGSTAVVNSPVAGNPYGITQGTLASGAGYAINYAGANLTVTSAPLTVAADNKVKILNDPNPPFTASFFGLAPGDGPGSFAGTLTFSTPAAADSPLGSYPITPFGLSSNNYVISFVDGTLLVRPQQLPENQALIVAVERARSIHGDSVRHSSSVQGCRKIADFFFDCR